MILGSPVNSKLLLDLVCLKKKNMGVCQILSISVLTMKTYEKSSHDFENGYRGDSQSGEPVAGVPRWHVS